MAWKLSMMYDFIYFKKNVYCFQAKIFLVNSLFLQFTQIKLIWVFGKINNVIKNLFNHGGDRSTFVKVSLLRTL